MTIDTLTVSLLNSTLATDVARRLFTRIATSRIADLDAVKTDVPEADKQVEALKAADLIGLGDSGKNLYVTAKGLRVARDLAKIPAI